MSAAGEEAVLEHEAGLHAALDYGDEFGAARVRVRAIQAAGVEEEGGYGEVFVDEDGESSPISLNITPSRPSYSGTSTKVEDNTFPQSIALQELLAGAIDCEESIESADVRDFCLDFLGQSNT